MIEDLHISVPLNEVPEAQVGNYFILSEMPGEFLIIQKPDNTFYFLCSRECDIVRICESFDWYIVSKDAFNDRLCIGIGLADKESIDGEVYRVQDEATLSLWRDILRFTFDSDFVRQFFPYNTRFKGKMRIDGALCFYIHDYYPTRCKGIAVEDARPAIWSSASRKDSRRLSSPKSSPSASPVCLSTRKRRSMPCLSPSRQPPVSATPPVSPGFAASFRIA